MKMNRKTNLGELLRTTARVPERPAADFWEDFRARATLVPQAVPSRTAAPTGRWLLAAASLAAAVMLIFAIALPRSGSNDGSLAVASLPTPAKNGRLSRIEEVQVFLDNASVTIIEDSENGGTVVFVEAAPQPNRT